MGLYIVQAGDTPGLIAKKFTGSENAFPDLLTSNPGKDTAFVDGSLTFVRLRTGEMLVLPNTWRIPVVGVSGPTDPGYIPAENDPVLAALKNVATSSTDVSKAADAAKALATILPFTTDPKASAILSDAASQAIALVKSGQAPTAGQIAATVAHVAGFAVGVYAAGAVAVGSMVPVVGTVVGAVVALGIGVTDLIVSALGHTDPEVVKPTTIDMYKSVARDPWNPFNILPERLPGPRLTDSPNWVHFIDFDRLMPGTNGAVIYDSSLVLSCQGNNPPMDAQYGNNSFNAAWMTNVCPGGFSINSNQRGTSACNDALVPCDVFTYSAPGTASYWMFGVVLNEIWRIRNPIGTLVGGVMSSGNGLASLNDAQRRTVNDFKLFFYNLLLHNWEFKANGAVNMSDRILLAGAVAVWNSQHSDSATYTFNPIPYEALTDARHFLYDIDYGFCHYEYRTRQNVPTASAVIGAISSDSGVFGRCPTRSGGDHQPQKEWSLTDISWANTFSFIEYIITGGETLSPLDQEPMPSMTINLGINPHVGIHKISLIGGPSVEAQLEGIVAQSDTAKAAAVVIDRNKTMTHWAWGLGVTATAAAGGLYWYARRHHLPVRSAAKQLASTAKQKVLSTFRRKTKALRSRRR
jgi:hypothetical protein